MLCSLEHVLGSISCLPFPNTISGCFHIKLRHSGEGLARVWSFSRGIGRSAALHRDSFPGIDRDRIHTTARDFQTCIFQGPGAPNTTKIPRKDPQRERQKEPTLGRKGKTKSRDFGPPTFRGGTLLGRTLRGPTSPFGPPLRLAHHDTHQICPKLGELAKVGLFRGVPKPRGQMTGRRCKTTDWSQDGTMHVLKTLEFTQFFGHQFKFAQLAEIVLAQIKNWAKLNWSFARQHTTHNHTIMVKIVIKLCLKKEKKGDHRR